MVSRRLFHPSFVSTDDTACCENSFWALIIFIFVLFSHVGEMPDPLIIQSMSARLQNVELPIFHRATESQMQ